MDRTTSFSPIFDDRIFPQHTKAMQHGAIASTIGRYADLLEGELKGRLDQLGTGQEVDLVDVLFDILVRGPVRIDPNSTVLRIVQDLLLPFLPCRGDEEQFLGI